MLDHNALTTALVAHMNAEFSARISSSALPLVSVGIAPQAGGWLNGQPGDGIYRPYTVIVAGGAAPRYLDLSSFDPEWAVSFSLRSFGGSYDQCEWMAALARNSVSTIAHKTFDTNWSIIGYEWDSLGPVSRLDSTAPPSWQVFDNLTLVTAS
jgi:hypothetical protein